AASHCFMSAYAAAMRAARPAESRTTPGFTLTCRMRLPVPCNMPVGSSSSAPRKKPTFTWSLKAPTYPKAASLTQAVGHPSWISSRTSRPHSRIRWNHVRAMAPSSGDCSSSQRSTVGSSLTAFGNRKSPFIRQRCPAPTAALLALCGCGLDGRGHELTVGLLVIRDGDTRCQLEVLLPLPVCVSGNIDDQRDLLFVVEAQIQLVIRIASVLPRDDLVGS